MSNYYGLRSWYLLFASRFMEAEEAARKGLNIKSNYVWIEVTLAHALLLQGKYEYAFEVYKALKGFEGVEGKLLISECLEDFDMLEENGITCKDITKIRNFLKN